MDKEREYTIEDITYGFFTENEGGLTLSEVKEEEEIALYLIKKLLEDPNYFNFLFKGYRNYLIEDLVNNRQKTYHFVKGVMDGLAEKLAKDGVPSGELTDPVAGEAGELDFHVEDFEDREIDLEKIFEDDSILDYLIEKIFNDEEYADFLSKDFDDLLMGRLIENETITYDFMSDVFYELHSKEIKESAGDQD